MRLLKGAGATCILILGLISPVSSSARVVSNAPAARCLAEDPISGHWTVTFKLGDISVPGELTLKLSDKSQITGTVNSDHTGLGTIRDGRWAAGKLSFTVDFTTHDSIVITGESKEGKLVGEFETEGNRGTWEGIKQ